MIKDYGKFCGGEVRDREPGRGSNICEGPVANSSKELQCC